MVAAKIVAAPGNGRALERMTRNEFIENEIDPLLDKISRSGIGSLSRAERRVLARARDKVG